MKRYLLFFTGFRGLILAVSVFILGCNQSKQSPKAGTTVPKDTTPEIKYDRYWNDLARYLAGMEPNPGSTLDSIANRPEALKHRKFMDDAWKTKESVLLSKLRNWAKQEFPDEMNSTGNVFYPFSGPDFITINTLFPKASKYLFFGQEPEGKLVDARKIPVNRLDANLKNLQQSLNYLLNRSYFVTKDMIKDLSQYDFRGVYPLILLFMARNGNEVLEVKRMRLNRGGKITYLKPDEDQIQLAQDTIVNGVEIKFRADKTAPVQTLQFLQFDAEDKYYKERERDVYPYIRTLKPTITYLKSASYLLHWPNFVHVRKEVLDVSDFILQDDTGVAYRFFDKKVWNIQLYGNYTQPIRDFASCCTQNDLAQAFKTDKTVKPLDFGIGYRHALGTTSLILARKIKSTDPKTKS